MPGVTVPIDGAAPEQEAVFTIPELKGSSVKIEGATPEQEALLREILAGLGATRIEHLLLEAYDTFVTEEGLEPAASAGERDETRGVAVALVAPEEPRAFWEAGLLGQVFRARSQDSGLENVVWLRNAMWGRSLAFGPAPAPPLADQDLEQLVQRVRAAVQDSGASLEGFDVLRPAGHAFVLKTRVVEPHDYLRNHLRSVLGALHSEPDEIEGIYLEVRDGEGSLVLYVGLRRYGAFAWHRPDLECCAPSFCLSQGIDYPGPPVCPVFGPPSWGAFARSANG